MGAGVYDFIGNWVPAGLVGWLMGVRKVGGDRNGWFGMGEFGGGKGVVKAIENAKEERVESSEGESWAEEQEGLGESGYVYPQRTDGEFANRA